MVDPTVYDHLRSTDPDDDDAIYRVVGTSADTVTLLRVSDGDGRRAHTGEVLTLSRDALEGFEPAENPDGGIIDTLRSMASGGYWTLRAGGPLMTAGVFLAVVGTLTNVGVVPLSPLAGNGLLFVGFSCIVAAIFVE